MVKQGIAEGQHVLETGIADAQRAGEYYKTDVVEQCASDFIVVAAGEFLVRGWPR